VNEKTHQDTQEVGRVFYEMVLADALNGENAGRIAGVTHIFNQLLPDPNAVL